MNSAPHGKLGADIERRRDSPLSSLIQSDYLSVRPIQDWLKDIAPIYAKGTLLDYGCGNKPYFSFFEKKIQRYIGVDTTQNKLGTVDVVVKLGEPLPFEASPIDTVLSTQVLEHIAQPEQYLQEIARILRRSGYLILTCPGAYMVHEEPNDFYRYTEYGLKYLLSRCKLEIVKLTTAGGAWRLIGQTFLNHKTFSRKWDIPVVSGIVYYGTVVSVNLMCSMLDKINTNQKDPSNYMLIAQK